MTSTDRFWAMLDQTFPAIQACWDREARQMKLDKMERFLGVASSGERHMALFFRDVWAGGAPRDEPFDVIEAIGVIDTDQAKLVRNWLAAPFWP